jgi:hypothetical protein
MNRNKYSSVSIPLVMQPVYMFTNKDKTEKPTADSSGGKKIILNFMYNFKRNSRSLDQVGTMETRNHSNGASLKSQTSRTNLLINNCPIRSGRKTNK